jgi:hypothetical protein
MKEKWITDANGNKCSVEKWLSVRGYSGSYEVSNLGRVRSVDRENINRNGVRRILRGKLLSLSLDGEGYAQVSLLRGGVERKARVHRLVAEAFLLNEAALPLVDHRDRNRGDNSVPNLRWASFSLNRRNTAMADIKRMAELEAAP